MMTDDKRSSIWYLFCAQRQFTTPYYTDEHIQWENPRREGHGLAQSNTGSIKIHKNIWLTDVECLG